MGFVNKQREQNLSEKEVGRTYKSAMSKRVKGIGVLVNACEEYEADYETHRVVEDPWGGSSPT